MNLTLILLILILLLLYFVVKKWHEQNKYWERKGIKSLPSIPILGNMATWTFQKESISELILKIYNQFKDERYFGMFLFTTPTLVINDPELIQTITIKKFDHFVDHTGFGSPDIDPLWGNNLFASKGNHWRSLRQTISPVFTSSKMRMIFVLMEQCVQNLINYINEQKCDLVHVEMRDILTRFTNDVIATTAFGIECNSLVDQNNEFILNGRELTEFTGWKRFLFFIHSNFPILSKLLQIKIVPNNVGDFFTNIIKESIKIREEQNVIRKDLIHLLLQARKGKCDDNDTNSVKTGYAEVEEFEMNSPKKHEFLTDVDIVAQALVFFFGGFDTVTTNMCFLMHELAVYADVQSRLRDEIQMTLKQNDGNITYEILLNMKYLDMVVNEALRKWPSVLFFDRVCNKPFTIKAKSSDQQSLTLNIGDVVWIPSYAIHHDSKYYPDPHRFDPERFNDENREKITPFTYLPFGSGPRNCIGSRYALLKTKLLVFNLVKNFEIVPTDKTQIPLKISKDIFPISADGGFHLGLKKIKKIIQ